MRDIMASIGSLTGLTLAMWAGVALAESPVLTPAAAVPGATISITGKGFGAYKSPQFNKVSFKGVPALVQRWESDLIEVKVPSKAGNGPVDVVIGKKKLSAGSFSVLQPSIRSVTPTEAERGSIIEILGEHFGNTAGPRDPNSIFGVNDVLIGGVPVRARKWRDDKIDVELPTNVQNGDVVVRLASSDPLPDGSCCAPVQHTVSNSASVKLLASIRVDPMAGPVGTKVVLFGRDFGATRTPQDSITIGNQVTAIASWSDTAIVVHVPLDAQSGPMVLTRNGQARNLGTFTVHTPKATSVSPASAPVGTLLRINGEHFGFYSESGATPYNFMDFSKGDNRVEIGGVPAIVYRWHDDRIDVWVPFSVKSGPVVVKRGGNKANPDGTCCASHGVVETEAGTFTVAQPMISSYSPKSAGLDETVTITGTGFGTFLKTAEASKVGITDSIYARTSPELEENVSRTEVLFNGIAAVVLSWTDTEIKVRVPRRHIVGFGKPGEYLPDTMTGPLIVRRGSWDLRADGTCCGPKQWITLEAGSFTIEPKGIPDQGYWQNNRPESSTNQ
ncbi:MAG: IPT/TIG domain-containing protein [Nitrospiraceae bacterium]|nr:IPT/TIG domain-containing protein [Nitrospiraceae bacterium]